MGAQGFRVIRPGVLSLLQDLGRFGYGHLGLTSGGAADEHAFLWANRLLGNAPNSAAVEVCFGGLQLQAQVSTRIALTGADLQVRLNDEPLTPWQTFRVRPGDRLRLGYPKTGVRAYLAVKGGFQVEPVLGSVATVMREHLGGLDGQGCVLKTGDLLPCAGAGEEPSLRVPWRFIPDYQAPLELRVIEGQQSALFSESDWKTLYSSVYRISSQSDRMGVRLSGEPLRPNVGGIISEGIGFGAVQVPPDGQPIVLLKDRQTIGGYPKLGTLFPLDAFALAQRQPHTPVRFAPMALTDAEQKMQEFYRFLMQ